MLEQIILGILAVLFLIVLPIISTIKYWNYKPLIKYALILIWISYAVIAYEIFYPRDSYYVNHLKNASNINFGEKTILKDKYTSFMNSKAQYYSCATFDVASNDIKLLNNIKKDDLKTEKLSLDLGECSKILNPMFTNKNLRIFKKVDEKNYLQWGFIENSNKVFVLYQFFGMANKE